MAAQRHSGIDSPATAALLLAVSFAANPTTATAEVIFEPSTTLTRETVDVAAGDRLTYAFRLERGTGLVFSLQTSRWRREPLRMWLVDAADTPSAATSRSFTGEEPGSRLVERRTNFAYTVPRTSNYHVVLDNTHADAPRTLDVYAYAKYPDLTPTESATKSLYTGYYEEIRQLFDFDDFDIVIARCGSENAYYQRSIVICRELDDVIGAAAPPGVRLFILMHEMAHRLLDVWGYSGTYHRQMQADRFAATLIELMGRDALGVSAAEWFASHEVAGAPAGDQVPFSISKSRARKISEWLTQTDHVDRGWTKRIVLPRMRTPALESLLASTALSASARATLADELHGRTRRDSPAR